MSIVEDNDSTLRANEVQQSLRNASTPPSRAPPKVPKEVSTVHNGNNNINNNNNNSNNKNNNNGNNGITKKLKTLDIFQGKRPHGWFYIKEKNEKQFNLQLCILWNNLILYLFNDQSDATHFFSSKMDSTNKTQRFIDLTMGLKLVHTNGIVNNKNCTIIEQGLKTELYAKCSRVTGNTLMNEQLACESTESTTTITKK